VAGKRKPRTRGQRRAARAAIALSLGLVAAAEHDLHRRPEAEVRGSKRVWRLVSLNALGALAYLLAGRRPGTG